MVSERLKLNSMLLKKVNCFFWRTTQQQEIDYIEEMKELHAFEFKWNSNKKVSFPKTFLSAYPKATTFLVNPKSKDEFLGMTNK